MQEVLFNIYKILYQIFNCNQSYTEGIFEWLVLLKGNPVVVYSVFVTPDWHGTC